MMKKYIKWCTGHYSLEACNEIKKQIRAQGFKCVTRDYVKEYGRSYARVYIEMDEAYKNKNGRIVVNL